MCVLGVDDEGELNKPRLWPHLGCDVWLGQALLSLDGAGLELNQGLLRSDPLSLSPYRPLPLDSQESSGQLSTLVQY